MPNYIGLNFEGKDDLKSKITADIAKKLEEIFEDEPMEDLIQYSNV